MFPIVLLVVLTGCLMSSICWYKKACKREDSCGEGEIALIVFSGIALAILLAAWPATYCKTLGEIADMEAFFEATKGAYEYTITATQEVEIKAVTRGKPSPLEVLDTGELAYQKLGPTASERIKELRDKVRWYNETLKRYRRWNRFWFSEAFVADVPEELKLIVLKQ